VLQSVLTGSLVVLEVDLEKKVDDFSDDGAKTLEENETSPLFDQILAYALNVL
jgi:hypothetical protein